MSSLNIPDYLKLRAMKENVKFDINELIVDGKIDDAQVNAS